MLKQIASRRRFRALKMANIVRPDVSTGELQRLQRQGYTQVVFVKNPTSDEECAPLDGNIYEIDALLKLDNPLFRISHPNCLCKFAPYGQSTGVQTLETNTQTTEPVELIQPPELPPITLEEAPTTKTV